MKFILKILAFICLSAVFACNSKSIDNEIVPKKVLGENLYKSPDTLFYKMIFAGDVMVHLPQIIAAKTDSGYNFNPNYNFIKSYIQSADFAFANLEVTLAGEPYTGYPKFASPDEVALALKEAGFDVLFTANNHSADRGKKGIERTLQILDSLNFKRTGTFFDSLDFKNNNPLILELGRFKIALINATYGTNGLSVSAPNIVQLLDTVKLKPVLEKTKSLNPDYTIVFVHWGNEYERKPSKQQLILAEFLANQSADYIIGSHPHVLQPFQIILDRRGREVPVMFSLGNFISNQRDRYKDGGGILELNFYSINDTLRLHSNTFMPTWTYKGRYQGHYNYYIIPVSMWEKNPDFFGLSKTDSIKISQFAKDSRLLLNNIKETQFYDSKKFCQ